MKSGTKQKRKKTYKIQHKKNQNDFSIEFIRF